MTGQEIFDFCKEKGTGEGISKKWSLRHCEVAAEAIQPNESFLMALIGAITFQGDKQMSGYMAVVLTDRRLLLAQKTRFGQSVKSIQLGMINDVRYSVGAAFGKIDVDSVKESFEVQLLKKFALKATMMFQVCLDQVLSMAQQPATIGGASSTDYATKVVEVAAQLDRMHAEGKITREEWERRRIDLFADLWKEE